MYYISFEFFFFFYSHKKQSTPWPGKTPHKDSTRLSSVTSKALYTHCPANISCFPSSHKKDTKYHWCAWGPSSSLFDSLTHAQTSCPIKSCRRRPPLSFCCGVELMLVKLAATDDWEPPRPWSADIILPLKCNLALQQCRSVCRCVPAVLFVLVQM